MTNRKEVDTLYRQDLYSFVQRAFQDVEPGEKLVPAKYLEALCHALWRVQTGASTRLVINMPPRHLKSLVTSVMWPAWMLMENPSKKIAIVCHDDNLTLQLAKKCKGLLNSSWYRRLAPHVRIEGLDRAKDFDTAAGGRVYATSIGSGITGHGFDVIILDDPQPARDAKSQTERQNVQTLFDGQVATRLNDPVRGAFVVVQQRLHEDDLSGYLLSQGGWEHLCLPLRAFEQRDYQTGSSTWTRPVGDVLMPERYPALAIDRLEAERGPQNFWTQYQQAPSSVQGEIIKPEHLKLVPTLPPSASMFYVSVDTASKAGPTSDYTVFMVIATDETRHYVLDVIRERMEVTAMRDVSLRLKAKYPIHRFLIEDSSSGPSLHTLLKENGVVSELKRVAAKDKEQRLRDHLHLFLDGRVYLIGDAPWIGVFRKEAETFPVGRYDDQIDALTLYFSHVEAKVPRKPVSCLAGGPGDGFPPHRPPAKGDNPLRPRSGHGLRTSRFRPRF